MNQFGSMLRSVRTKRGVSLRRLAHGMGITEAYLSNVETGRRLPFARGRREDAAKVIGIDAGLLHEAAARARGWGPELQAAERRGLRLALYWCLNECGSKAELRARLASHG